MVETGSRVIPCIPSSEEEDTRDARAGLIDGFRGPHLWRPGCLRRVGAGSGSTAPAATKNNWRKQRFGRNCAESGKRKQNTANTVAKSSRASSGLSLSVLPCKRYG